MTSAQTALIGLLGWPVAHSRSPALHSAACADTGIDASYLALPVAPTALGDAVRGLAAVGARGFNITLPHKQAVMAHLDVVEPAAKRIGAVNTVVRQDGGWRGMNTDAPGLVRSLEEAGVALAGRNVVVLGAGGAARAAVVGCFEAGVDRLTVSARRPDAAGDLLRSTGVDGTATGLGDALEAAFSDADLVVQATSATLHPEHAQPFADALPLGALPAHAAVVDLVYSPRRTTVLCAAEARGLTTVDGLGMLVWQAALAFGRWFDVPPPVEAMRRAAE
ncbi:MAG: shikimate dehydrogenase [Sandaracinaceae bacterium]